MDDRAEPPVRQSDSRILLERDIPACISTEITAPQGLSYGRDVGLQVAKVSAMNVPRRLGAMFVAATLVGALPVVASSSSATMQVSVQVIARAIVTVDGQPSSVTITAGDLARGYVDIDSPILVHVRTNSRQGYMLQVDNVSDAFSSIEVSSGDVTMNVAHESWIQRPYVSGGDLLPIHARLHLAAGATAGSAPVSIAFNASPL